jgi:tetraacyldisaccharide 4'-kinase
MDEPFAIDVLSGRLRGVVPAGLRAAAACAEPFYAAAVALRNAAYDRGWKRGHRAPAPVVSVGNLTTGGTGKTPVVAWLAERLRQSGRSPAIVSRGYRSLDAQSNDERLVLQQLFPGVPLIQNRDRFAGAQRALEEFGCDVVLLDDGFQHRRLARDLDLVLIDATRPFGFDHLLPRGLLREPLAALKRADLVLVTRCDQAAAQELTEIRRRLRQFRGTEDCVELRFAPLRLRNAEGQIQPLSLLRSAACLPFCGIGNPEGFRRTLSALGIEMPGIVFPDHHFYQSADLERISEAAAARNASLLATTQKDLVKIPHTKLDGRPLWAIEIAAEIVSGNALLERHVERIRIIGRRAA